MNRKFASMAASIAVVVVGALVAWFLQQDAGSAAHRDSSVGAPVGAPSAPSGPSGPSGPSVPTAPSRRPASVTPPAAEQHPKTRSADQKNNELALDLASVATAHERTAIIDLVPRIDQGGPFAYRKDGTIFQNREGRLPTKSAGYYREYTVPTPGSDDRGARRIVGGNSGELYYSADHYRTFAKIRTATR